MPTGVYKRTEEHKKNLSKSMKDFYETEEGDKLKDKRSRRMEKDNPSKRPEVKRKLSEYMKANNPMKNPTVAKKTSKTRLRKNIKHSEETKKKISKNNGMKNPEVAKKHGLQISGENAPNWKGGISFEPYGEKFNDDLKFIVRFRDNFTCQLCGFEENERPLDVHHIDYDKKNNSLNNLISLCRSCHVKTNYNRKKWEKMLQTAKHKAKALPNLGCEDSQEAFLVRVR